MREISTKLHTLLTLAGAFRYIDTFICEIHCIFVERHTVLVEVGHITSAVVAHVIPHLATSNTALLRVL